MRRERGQALVEFVLTIGLWMLVVIGAGELAIFQFYDSSLRLAAQEGAFQASLVGHGPADASTTTRQLWTELAPNGGPLKVSVTSRGDLVTVSAQASAPVGLPIRLNARATHTIERFRPGSAP